MNSLHFILSGLLIILLICTAATPAFARNLEPLNSADDTDYVPQPDLFVPCEKAPEMTFEQKPDYPKKEYREGIEGTVWIGTTIDTAGIPTDIVVRKSSGSPALDSAAVQAAHKCRYSPAIYQDRPVAMSITYKVEFVIDPSQKKHKPK